MGRIPTLAVNEIFGPTFQGEGKNAGMLCAFLRLAGCNLACQWCDTPYTWNWKQYKPRDEIHFMAVNDVLNYLIAAPVKSLVISGGEPMLQQKALRYLTTELHCLNWWTEIETAGTVKPDGAELVKQFTVSPKLKNSGNSNHKRYKPDALDFFSSCGRAVFKFVVCDLSDFDEIDGLVKTHNLKPVYIMPEGVDRESIDDRLKVIAGAVIERGYNLTGRLHISIYGQRRGI